MRALFGKIFNGNKYLIYHVVANLLNKIDLNYDSLEYKRKKIQVYLS